MVGKSQRKTQLPQPVEGWAPQPVDEFMGVFCCGFRTAKRENEVFVEVFCWSVCGFFFCWRFLWKWWIVVQCFNIPTPENKTSGWMTFQTIVTLTSYGCSFRASRKKQNGYYSDWLFCDWTKIIKESERYGFYSFDVWNWSIQQKTIEPPKPIYTPLKWTCSPLKMDGWNTIVSFWDGLFSGANC